MTNHHYRVIGNGSLEHSAVKDSVALCELTEKKHFSWFLMSVMVTGGARDSAPAIYSGRSMS